VKSSRWVFVFLVAAMGLGGCSSSPKAANVSDVVRGETIAVDPTRFSARLPPEAIVIEATVADVQPGEDLLVELSDGREEIWVSGFTEAPARASTVLTALLGGPQPHPTRGTIYPSSGVLDPEDVVSGFTDRGALAVVVGVALSLILLIPALASIVRRFRGGRNCPECRQRLHALWRTCPRCGRAQELPQGIVTQAQAASEPPAPVPAATVPPPREDVSDVPAPVERPTRIVRRD